MITSLSHHRNRCILAYFRMRKTSGSMEKYNIISRCENRWPDLFPCFPTGLVRAFPTGLVPDRGGFLVSLSWALSLSRILQRSFVEVA